MSLPAWARAHGEPLFAATIRATPADFDVTEELGFEFSGDGEHDWVFVQKTAANTDWVAHQLARIAGVSPKDVGYSGLKDRHALTRQWFSVPRRHDPNWDNFEIEGVSVLDVRRHSRKLKRGTHKSNRFRIVLRGELPDAGTLDARLCLIRDQGVPNYFGPQRFGRNGANVELANRWSEGARLPRHKRSIAISTARSFLFNEYLHARIVDKCWNRVRPGDVANLDGTGSVFDVAEVDDVLVSRCEAMDIHPAGILWGDGADPAAAATGHDNWLAALQNARVRTTYRALRLRVCDLEWGMQESALVLEFRLGRGAFATSVLTELARIESGR